MQSQAFAGSGGNLAGLEWDTLTMQEENNKIAAVKRVKEVALANYNFLALSRLSSLNSHENDSLPRYLQAESREYRSDVEENG